MNNIKKTISILGLMIFLISCNEDTITNPQNNIPFSIQSGGVSYTLSDLLSENYTQGMVGLLEFNSEKRNDLSWTKYAGGGKDFHPFDGIDNYCYAGFRDNNNEPFTLENVLINACLLREYSKGAYSKENPEDLDLYFDGSASNKYYLECLNNSLIPDSVFGQVTFSERIEITNIQRYDTIYKSQNNQITWTGGYTSGKVEIGFGSNDSDEDSLYMTAGFYNIVDNTGSFTIDSLYLADIVPANRYFDLYVTSYEPKFVTLSNGNKICLLGVTKHNITVYLKD